MILKAKIILAGLRKEDLRKVIAGHKLDFQNQLNRESMDKLHDEDFKQWLETKTFRAPAFELKLQFGSMYYNYRINELLENNKMLPAHEYINLKKIWLTDYTSKFWILNRMYNEGSMLDQKQFRNFFTIGEKLE